MQNIVFDKTPNFTPGNGTFKPIGFIIHGTLGSYGGSVSWLKTPPEKRPVISYSSAHYVVAKDGRCTQLVADTDISWHAGNISNPTEEAKKLLPASNGKSLNPNFNFIGIELEWFVGDVVTSAQYDTIMQIIKKVNIKDPVILCHRQITDYKSDFTTKDGKTDLTVVNEVRKRLLAASTTVPAPTPEKVDTITPLLAKLNTQLAAKNFREAKDTTQYLFNEIAKAI